jgi:hypothetical protein
MSTQRGAQVNAREAKSVIGPEVMERLKESVNQPITVMYVHKGATGVADLELKGVHEFRDIVTEIGTVPFIGHVISIMSIKLRSSEEIVYRPNGVPTLCRSLSDKDIAECARKFFGEEIAKQYYPEISPRRQSK